MTTVSTGPPRDHDQQTAHLTAIRDDAQQRYDLVAERHDTAPSSDSEARALDALNRLADAQAELEAHQRTGLDDGVD